MNSEVQNLAPLRFEQRLLHWMSQADPRRRDPWLALLAIALPLLGLLALYSASSVIADRAFGDPRYYFEKQLGWFLVGACFFLLLASLRLELLYRFALPLLLAVIALLALAFVPGIGKSVAGQSESFHRWLAIGPITLQPSELAKIAIPVYYAQALNRRGALQQEYDLRRLFGPTLLVGAALALILLGPQYGTTMCMLAALLALLYVSGFPMMRLAALALAALPLLLLLLALWQYRLDRLMVWFDPWSQRHAGGYQLVTSFRAFQDGAWVGAPLASGFSHRYLTYGHTDFILALFAEDFGWLGLIVLAGLYSAFLWRAVYFVRRLRDPFALLLGAGLLAMLFLQILLNMAVVTGLTPTTGVSLPFLSYGGSSFIVSMGLAGLLVNLSGQEQSSDEQEPAEFIQLDESAERT
ncbi:MAG: FtsW/RodA/SpoVE family cell cycle protein [Leptospirales bacterium]|nr:FtsW/RodA/SpoVE family cell cycle protein [Leptospirales bacterium]